MGVGITGAYLACGLLRLAPMVFVRPGQLRAAEWKEFNLDAGEWRIGAERMKMRVQHIVPLSRQAVEILRELEPVTGHRPIRIPKSSNRQTTVVRQRNAGGTPQNGI
jgi:integrase